MFRLMAAAMRETEVPPRRDAAAADDTVGLARGREHMVHATAVDGLKKVQCVHLHAPCGPRWLVFVWSVLATATTVSRRRDAPLVGPLLLARMRFHACEAVLRGVPAAGGEVALGGGAAAVARASPLVVATRCRCFTYDCASMPARAAAAMDGPAAVVARLGGALVTSPCVAALASMCASAAVRKDASGVRVTAPRCDCDAARSPRADASACDMKGSDATRRASCRSALAREAASSECTSLNGSVAARCACC